jgi:hypothetical protein
MNRYNPTIEDVTTAAAQNTEKYIDRAKTVARNAFIEGAVWALKASAEGNHKTFIETL